MTLDIYNVLIGIISAAVFQFVIFAVHIRDYKKEKFLSIWLLDTEERNLLCYFQTQAKKKPISWQLL